ncbi:translation initiation factor IF-2-like [Vulpes lagopus]|uniref:translation initiation factor IF-2-like n=1 Tax=Vulpes lagopus TaxID=494514 RepID=UPI001BC9C581|nr:translation initiation factor IF-2-like [Vulpes lagopus]XP_041626297.1 translation initiation factor IF-2-like [Vulpes lagopus]
MTGSQRRTSAHLSLGPGGGCCRSPGHRAHPAPAARAARLALAISWLRGEGPHGAGPGAGRGAAKWVGPGMERLARAGGLHGGGGAARRLAAGARGKAEATHTPHALPVLRLRRPAPLRGDGLLSLQTPPQPPVTWFWGVPGAHAPRGLPGGRAGPPSPRPGPGGPLRPVAQLDFPTQTPPPLRPSPAPSSLSRPSSRPSPSPGPRPAPCLSHSPPRRCGVGCGCEVRTVRRNVLGGPHPCLTIPIRITRLSKA